MVAMNIIDIYDNFNSYFSADLKKIFEQCSKVASKSGFKLYLIGGIVRDLLLDRRNLDIDITVEGDAIEFARILEKEGVNAGINAKILSIHQDFGTVKVQLDGKKIDFASTRSEKYPKKGHLPQVEKIGCSLKEDMLRRDFTVNSLAISLNEENFAHVIDYVGGFEDLKAKKIRILHDKSFIDDPTRIIRALRYSQSLGFELDEKTFKLQEDYLDNINYDMGFSRVKNEIKRTFQLNLQSAFEKFIDQKIYKLITKSEIKKPETDIEDIINKYSPKNPWLVYFGVVAIQENEEFLDRLELTKIEKNTILEAQKLKEKNLKNDFEIYKAFDGKSIESLLIIVALGFDNYVFHYLNDLQKIKLEITGDDLIKLGHTPSKAFIEAFDYVLKQKLKTPQIEKPEELKLILEYFKK